MSIDKPPVGIDNPDDIDVVRADFPRYRWPPEFAL